MGEAFNASGTGRKESPVERIQNTFMYHKPFGSQTTRYEALRVMAKNLAYNIEQLCPDSREKSLALTNLQQTIMWANASIAINEKDPNPAAGDEQESLVADRS